VAHVPFQQAHMHLQEHTQRCWWSFSMTQHGTAFEPLLIKESKPSGFSKDSLCDSQGKR
jgi:hypothetical protein